MSPEGRREVQWLVTGRVPKREYWEDRIFWESIHTPSEVVVEVRR